MWRLVNVILVMMPAMRLCEIHQLAFHKSSICDVNQRILEGCTSIQSDRLRGEIECEAICARDDQCIGASVDAHGRCFTHQQCSVITGCTAASTDHAFKAKSCLNDGIRDSVDFRCRCVNGMSGSMCEIYPTSCNDLLHVENVQRIQKTTLDVYRDGSHLMPVVCRCFASWCQVLSMFNAGETDFNKTWVEYRDGFFIDESHYWIGLENMYILYTLGAFKTMAAVVNFKDGSITSRRHSNVVIENEANGYSLTFKSTFIIYTNSKGYRIEDCWAGIQSRPFSTWDQDLDIDIDNNCAADAGSGWWYDDCNTPCNVLGWAVHYSQSKPSSSIMRFSGIDMVDEADNIQEFLLAIW